MVVRTGCSVVVHIVIEIQAGRQETPPQWKASNAVTNNGQHGAIVSDVSPGGEVDLFYS